MSPLENSESLTWDEYVRLLYRTDWMQLAEEGMRRPEELKEKQREKETVMKALAIPTEGTSE